MKLIVHLDTYPLVENIQVNSSWVDGVQSFFNSLSDSLLIASKSAERLSEIKDESVDHRLKD
jgi:hypothetical protein